MPVVMAVCVGRQLRSVEAVTRHQFPGAPAVQHPARRRDGWNQRAPSQWPRWTGEVKKDRAHSPVMRIQERLDVSEPLKVEMVDHGGRGSAQRIADGGDGAALAADRRTEVHSLPTEEVLDVQGSLCRSAIRSSGPGGDVSGGGDQAGDIDADLRAILQDKRLDWTPPSRWVPFQARGSTCRWWCRIRQLEGPPFPDRRSKRR